MSGLEITSRARSIFWVFVITSISKSFHVPASYEGGGFATSNKTWLESMSLNLNLVKSIP